MSKVLYPKPTATTEKKAKSTDPYVVLDTDPTGDLPDETRSYGSEAEAKAGAWYHCRVIGFHKAAELFTRDEWNGRQ